MFYEKEIEEKVRIPPQKLKEEITKAILETLRQKYEGQITEDGMILSVYDVDYDPIAKVVDGDPFPYVATRFKMLVFRPVVNEIVPARVSQLVDFGFFADIGPVDALVHLSQIGPDFFTYDKRKGVLAGRSTRRTLKKGDVVYVKIATVSLKDGSMRVGATMRGEGLGKKEWLKAKEKKEKSKK